jgi:hypothetical protein
MKPLDILSGKAKGSELSTSASPVSQETYPGLVCDSTRVETGSDRSFILSLCA